MVVEYCWMKRGKWMVGGGCMIVESMVGEWVIVESMVGEWVIVESMVGEWVGVKE